MQKQPDISVSRNPPDSIKVHPAFELKRSKPIESLKIVVEEYLHRKTGALHYHLSADNTENVFLVGLRTMPQDSTGVAHILEHTALCGSKRYPVRDPFFMMIRRSLNTFMNAFTSSDWTAYPFASQNRRDFFNLLDVYLDAVFFSRLNQLDFMQEGHRLEFENPQDPDSKLVYKGVVYNEMIGSMGSPVNTLWQTLTRYLFPTTTYHYNSGGDPEHIPDLTYEQFMEFYKTHYHPSNAIFMTYGDIPVYELQERIESRALSHFDRLSEHLSVHDEKRYHAPVTVEEHYAFDDEENAENKTHIVMGWLCGQSTDLEESMKAHLLSGVLLDNSSSPLLQALETTDLGNAPSPLCGLEDSNREITFMCGIEGSKPQNAQALEDLVMGVLQRVAEQGVPQEQMESVLHQLELEQREVGGGHYPYGLQLILDGLSSAVHYGDPVAALNLDPVLNQLREDIKNPEFIKNLVKSYLIDNPHRVRLTLAPDSKLSARRQKHLAAKLAKIKAGLSVPEKRNIIDLAQKLAERQQKKDDESVLPKVGLEDIPDEMHIAEGEIRELNGYKTTNYAQGTNGLVYQQIVCGMPKLSDDLLQHLPYYTATLTELGCGGRNYVETQALAASVTGGISPFTTTRGKCDDVQAVSSYFFVSGKALARNHDRFCQLMRETLESPRFDELDRIRELIGQQRAHREQSVTGQGHTLAMIAASSGLSPAAQLKHQLSGLQGIKHIKQLDAMIEEQDNLKTLTGKFQAIHDAILAAERQYLLIGEPEHLESFMKDLSAVWAGSRPATSNAKPFSLNEISRQVKQLWIANSPINFCARAYPAVPIEHDDAAPLTVLGGFLRNGYLHTAIREKGGAYGGGASYTSDIAAFRFYSYRDPRLVDTLNDFDTSIDWLLTEKHEWRQVEEAILGVISSIDKPSSPAGEAKDAFQNALFGRTPEKRRYYRSRILKVTLDDLKRVAQTYFDPAKASTAVITNAATLEQHGDLGMDVIKL
ncbi:MAG: insulinase family protein [Gammaproteobacteria bacterium]|nr:insulinase family protein [Gammaproteobacteria bacterium]